MKSLIIYPAFPAAIPNFLTKTANYKIFFRHTLFAISFNIVFNLGISFEDLPYLNDKSVRIFDIIIKINILVFFSSYLSTFNQIFFLFYCFYNLLDKRVCSDISEPFPYPYLL